MSDRVNPTVPNIARVYDYWLGGKNNFAADRELAEKLIAAAGYGGPNPRSGARQNRAFLGRAVRLVAEAGIRQFLDLGTGLPAMGNVHEIARDVDPHVRVAYVDYDPVVCAHGRAILADNVDVRMVEADLRDIRQVLEHPDVTALIDFTRPVAVLAVAVLHYLDDQDDPHGIVARLKGLMAPGSHLVLSHISAEPNPDVSPANAHFAGSSAQRTPRSRAEIRRFFDGLELLEPGIVNVPLWRPDEKVPPHADRFPVLAGVGRKG